MKNRKLLFLLVAILSLAVVLSACEQTDSDKKPDPVDTTAQQTTQGTEQTQGTETETQEAALDHEFYDYFELAVGGDGGITGEVVQYEGQIQSTDMAHDLVVIKTQDLDSHNMLTETYAVYNVLTGKKLLETSVSNMLYEHYGKNETLDVAIDYPVICVSRVKYVENDRGVVDAQYEYTYYLTSNPTEPLHTTTDTSYERVECGNGLVMLTLGDEVFWIDRNMHIVRTVDAIITNGYRIDDGMYNGEYQGYLYVWDDEDPRELQIFNRQGICSGRYVMEHDGELNIQVLNNGNVLIQDIEVRESPIGAYDFMMYGEYCTVTSYIMNFVDGTLTEIELDFIVNEIGTAYEEICNTDSFPFRLAAGRENQAIIYRFAGGRLAHTPEYVCMTSELEIEYAVKNDTLGVDISSAFPISDRLYVAPVATAGVWQYHIFDLDGNDLAVYSGDNTERFIVTYSTIYDLKMNPVYDIIGNGFTYSYSGYLTGTIFLNKVNYLTGATEYYVFDAATKKPVLLSDGVESEFIEFPNFYGLYATLDPETGLFNLIGMESGEVIAVMTPTTEIEYTGNALILIPHFEDEHIVYIIK